MNNIFFSKFTNSLVKPNRNFITFLVLFFLLCVFQINNNSVLQNCFADTASSEKEKKLSDTANKISSFVNDSTFVVVHINLTNIDLQAQRKYLTKIINRVTELPDNDDNFKKNVLNETNKLFDRIFPAINNIVVDLTNHAGLSDLYLVGNLINLDETNDTNLQTVFFLAIPNNLKDLSDKNIAARQKIERILKFVSNQAELSETNLAAKNDLLLYPLLPIINSPDNPDIHDNGINALQDAANQENENENFETENETENNLNKKNITVMNENYFRNYINKFSATKNPFLTDALKHFDNDLIKIVFLFSKPIKTFLVSLSIDNSNSPQVTNLIKYIINQINYVSIGIDPVKFRVHAAAQAKSASSAEQIQNGISGLIDLGVTFINTFVNANISLVGFSDKLSPVFSFAIEVLRGTAHFFIPATDKNNLIWNYEIIPEKTSPEFAAYCVYCACIVCELFEIDCEKKYDKWQKEIKPLLAL
jgi:hypothetical protein